MRLLKHPLMVFLVAFVILVVATQCGPTPTPQVIKETVVVTKEIEKEVEVVVTATPEPEKAEALPQAPDKKVALIIAQGGLGDRSYNDSGFAGLTKAAQDFGVQVKTLESPDPVGEGEKLLRTAAESGFDLVITLEYSHFEPLDRVALDYPDTMFSILNIAVDQPNVVSVIFKEHEGSFLAGALAAMVTSNPDIPGTNPENVIGVIGGTKSLGIDKFLVGYEEGAHCIDPEVEVLTAYSEAFGDPAKGKELTLAMFEQGADIVYQVAGGTGEGVIAAARLEAGGVAININDVTDIRGPFGGRKASGIGRELGQPGLDSYLEMKHVRVRRRRPMG